jgi:ACS family tartrate transporter-like MFS transporter
LAEPGTFFQGKAKLKQQMSNFHVGLLTMIPYIFAGIAMIIWARHSDKTGERRWHAAIPPIIGAIGLSGCALSSSPVVSMIFLSVTTIGLFSFFAPFWSIPNRFLTEASAAVGIVVINSIGNFGGFLGPYLMGYTKKLTGTLSSGLYFLSAALIICAILLLAFRHERSRTDSSTMLEAKIG